MASGTVSKSNVDALFILSDATRTFASTGGLLPCYVSIVDIVASLCASVYLCTTFTGFEGLHEASRGGDIR